MGDGGRGGGGMARNLVIVAFCSVFAASAVRHNVVREGERAVACAGASSTSSPIPAASDPKLGGEGSAAARPGPGGSGSGAAGGDATAALPPPALLSSVDRLA